MRTSQSDRVNAPFSSLNFSLFLLSISFIIVFILLIAFHLTSFYLLSFFHSILFVFCIYFIFNFLLFFIISPAAEACCVSLGANTNIQEILDLLIPRVKGEIPGGDTFTQRKYCTCCLCIFIYFVLVILM